LRNDLDVHGGLAGLARALAVHAVLADQDQSIRQEVESDCEAAPLQAHHEFETFQVLGAVFVNGHLHSE